MSVSVVSNPVFYGAAQMSTGANLVSLVKPASELLVQLIDGTDAEVMDIQAPGIRAGSGEPRIFHTAWQVKVPPQRMPARDGSSEPSPGALEGDRTLGDRIAERAAGLRQLDKPAVQRDNLGRLAPQVTLDCPFAIHAAKATLRSWKVRRALIGLGLWPGSPR